MQDTEPDAEQFNGFAELCCRMWFNEVRCFGIGEVLLRQKRKRFLVLSVQCAKTTRKYIEDVYLNNDGENGNLHYSIV